MTITLSHTFKKLLHVAFLSQLVILSGCGKSVEDTITDSIELEIYKKFNSEITGSAVEIKAFENSGTEVAPNYKSRFVATFELRKPRYKQLEIVKIPGGKSFNLIEQVYSAGDNIEAFGTSSSKIASEKLVTSISIDSFGSDVGDLYETFGSPIIKGSKEHEEILKEVKRAHEIMSEAVLKFRKSLIGDWKGSYICRNEEYKFILELTNIYMVKSANGDSEIVLNARHKEVINTESFELSGTLGVDGSFELNPTKWINHIDGKLNGYLGKYEEGTNKIAGDMTHARGCTTFMASRN